MPFRPRMAFSSNSVMRPDGDSRMNLLYQWCMSSARMSSRFEPWFPIGAVLQVHRGRKRRWRDSPHPEGEGEDQSRGFYKKRPNQQMASDKNCRFWSSAFECLMESATIREDREDKKMTKRVTEVRNPRRLQKSQQASAAGAARHPGCSHSAAREQTSGLSNPLRSWTNQGST